jgi:hypothetical protein
MPHSFVDLTWNDPIQDVLRPTNLFCLEKGRTARAVQLFIRVIKLTVINIEEYNLSATYKILYNILLLR